MLGNTTNVAVVCRFVMQAGIHDVALENIAVPVLLTKDLNQNFRKLISIYILRLASYTADLTTNVKLLIVDTLAGVKVYVMSEVENVADV